MKQIRFILLIAFATGCKYFNPGYPTNAVSAPEKSASAYKSDKVYENGTYCATIEYFNPDTEANSTCNLSVEVQNNELVHINSCDCNWADKSQFVATKLDETGSAIFTGNKSSEFTITIDDKNLLRSRRFQCDICGRDIK